MTHSRSTFLLVLAALALLTYILVFERHQPDSTQQATSARRLFPALEPSKVSRISILSTNGSIRAERQGADWRLADPVYPALSLPIESWLEAMAGLTRRAHVTASELVDQPGTLVVFGLDPPRASIVIEQGTRRFQFRLGARAPLGDRIYLEIVGSDGIEITEASAFDRMPVRSADWRDPALLFLSRVRLDRIHMRTAAREYEVQRNPTNGIWRLARPRSARADTGRIEQLLQQLQEVRVAQFVNDFPTADLDPYGLQPPEVTLGFADGTNQLLTLEFGRSPTNAADLVYARRSNLPGIIAIPRAVRDRVAVSHTDLLDYQLIDFPTEAVTRVELQTGAALGLERQTNGSWRLSGAPGRPIDPALMQGFLKQLRSLRMTEVAKELVTELDLPTYGLASPLRRYGVQWHAPGANATNTLGVRLDFGTNRADLVYARRADENSVYLVRLGEALALPAAAFELRDRRVWSFDTNQVMGMTLTDRGKSWRLVRSPGGGWSFAPGSQGLIAPLALEEASHRIGQLWARAWTDEGAQSLERYGFDQINRRIVIDVQRGERVESLTVDFGATSPSGGPFAAVTLEGGPTVFEFPLEIHVPLQEVLRNLNPPDGGVR